MGLKVRVQGFGSRGPGSRLESVRFKTRGGLGFGVLVLGGVKNTGIFNYPVAAAQPAQSAREGRAVITAPLLSIASTSDPSSTLFVAVSHARITNTHADQNGILLDTGRGFRHAVQVGLRPCFSMCQCQPANHGFKTEVSGQL